jgi:DNA-binding MarR family transcriptional regulator
MRKNNIDLTFEMLLVLRSLHYSGIVNQQELANRTYKDKSSLSYLINNLENRDIVKRVEDPEDKRSKKIVMTEYGELLFKTIQQIIENVYEEMSQNQNLSHIQSCIDYMNEFKDNLAEE